MGEILGLGEAVGEREVYYFMGDREQEGLRCSVLFGKLSEYAIG